MQLCKLQGLPLPLIPGIFEHESFATLPRRPAKASAPPGLRSQAQSRAAGWLELVDVILHLAGMTAGLVSPG